MRSRVSVGLVMLCLGLAGCGIFHKNKNENQGKPFTGLQANQDPNPGPGRASGPGAEPNLPPRVDGVVAGRVVNKFSNRGLSSAYIDVIDMQDPRPNEAALRFETDNEGYFYIPNLLKGKHYRLIARTRGAGTGLSGSEMVTPPNPKVMIMASDDPTVGNDTPFGPPPLPGQAPFPPGSTQPGPPATLSPPVRTSGAVCSARAAGTADGDAGTGF